MLDAGKLQELAKGDLLNFCNLQAVAKGTVLDSGSLPELAKGRHVGFCQSTRFGQRSDAG